MGVKFDPENGIRIDANKMVTYCQFPRETEVFDIPMSEPSNSQKDWKKRIEK